jgi:hypothetical protein
VTLLLNQSLTMPSEGKICLLLTMPLTETTESRISVNHRCGCVSFTLPPNAMDATDYLQDTMNLSSCLAPDVPILMNQNHSLTVSTRAQSISPSQNAYYRNRQESSQKSQLRTEWYELYLCSTSQIANVCLELRLELERARLMQLRQLLASTNLIVMQLLGTESDIAWS